MLITSGMRITGCGMQIDWELREAGPRGGARTVLLLPGGLCGAGSYAEMMAEPALAGVRLVAATLPGHAGAPPPDDYSIENYALLTSELAMDVGADVVVGFSMSSKDESALFRAVARLGGVLGGLPSAVLAKGAASMVKRIPVSAERQAELRADFAKNVPQHLRRGLSEYVRYLHRHERPAERLCQAGVPTWIVHAEKGDGGLTDDERRALEMCPHVHLVTIPGSVFFLPNEVPDRIAQVIMEAVAAAGSPARAQPAAG